MYEKFSLRLTRKPYPKSQNSVKYLRWGAYRGLAEKTNSQGVGHTFDKEHRIW